MAIDIYKNIRARAEAECDFPTIPGWKLAIIRLRNRLRWPQCDKTHTPYAHMTDDECAKSWLVGNDANKKRYYCMRKRWHYGKCRDIHGLEF